MEADNGRCRGYIMNVPFFTPFTPDAGSGTPFSVPDGQDTAMATVDGAESGFQKLLEGEGEGSDLLDQIRDRLSEEQLEQLEALLADGNELLMDGKELPHPAILTLLQQALESDGLIAVDDVLSTVAAGKSPSTSTALSSMLLREGRAQSGVNASTNQGAAALQPGEAEGTVEVLSLKEMLRLLPSERRQHPP
jgi:hypothetical protein